MNKELKNKVAIITGSYGDIGNAIAKGLASSGIKLALLGRDAEKLDLQREKLFKANDVDILSIECDVKNSKSFENAVQQVFSNWNTIIKPHKYEDIKRI